MYKINKIDLFEDIIHNLQQKEFSLLMNASNFYKQILPLVRCPFNCVISRSYYNKGISLRFDLFFRFGHPFIDDIFKKD